MFPMVEGQWSTSRSGERQRNTHALFAALLTTRAVAIPSRSVPPNSHEAWSALSI